MGETLARHIFEVEPAVNLNSQKGDNSMSENEIEAISEKTYVKLTLPAFVTLLLALISVVFSAGVFIWKIQSDVESKLDEHQYTQDRIRDSARSAERYQLILEMEKKVNAISVKLDIHSDNRKGK